MNTELINDFLPNCSTMKKWEQIFFTIYSYFVYKLLKFFTSFTTY